MSDDTASKRPNKWADDEERLARHWDAISMRKPSPGDLDPGMAHALRSFHDLAASEPEPIPDPTFIRTLLGDLMKTAAPLAPLEFPPNGVSHSHAKRRLPFLSSGDDHMEPRPRGSGMRSHLATAALVVLVLIGTIVASRIGRGSGKDPRSEAIPVFGEAAASPEVLDSGPIATFLWQTAGGPAQPFAKVKSWAGTGLPAAAPDGALWISDATRQQIQVFTSDGAYVESWGGPGVAPGEFNFLVNGYPRGAVAFDADGNIFVADAGNYRIQKFGPDRTFIAAFGSEGASDGAFLDLCALAIDPQGRVIALDAGSGNLEVFDNDGKWLSTWGRRGAGPGELTSPTGLAIDHAGNVWVADAGRNQIVQFSPTGEPGIVWDDQSLGKGVLIGPQTLAIDAQDRVFVADSGYRVQVLTMDGTSLGAWGSRGDEDGEFRLPVGLALGRGGMVYVTDAYIPRVQAFRTHLPIAAPPVGSPPSLTATREQTSIG
ncbi:MAG: NHL repeat-containing protein [Thermomicrobiales bacterium]